MNSVALPTPNSTPNSSSTPTPDAVANMVRQGQSTSDPDFCPLLQVINIKSISSASGERFRVVLSDGTLYVQGMLATQLNHLIHRGTVQVDCIIRADEYMVNFVQERTVIILLKATVVGMHPGRVGAPVDVEKSAVKHSSVGVGGGTGPNPNTTHTPLYNSTNSTVAGAGAGATTTTAGTNAHAHAHAHAASYHKPATITPAASNNPYGGVKRESPANKYGSRAPIVANHSAMHTHTASLSSSNANPSLLSNTTPIAALNMYNNRWTIAARLQSKSDIRTWSNAKGEGSLFSVELLDADGMDIRATFFKEAVDKFYHMLTVGQTYRLSGGRLKVANLKYNTCKSNMEISFDQNAEVHLDQSLERAIQKAHYEFVSIASLADVEVGNTATATANTNNSGSPSKPAVVQVDILAICLSVGEVATIVSKRTGNELIKCDLVLMDASGGPGGTQINMTLWGDAATCAPTQFAHQPLVAFRRARLSDYGGRSLSLGASFDVLTAPYDDVAGAADLAAWWQAQGGVAPTSATLLSASGGGAGGRSKPPVGQRQEIISIQENHLGQNTSGGGADGSTKPDYLTFGPCKFVFIKRDKEGGAWYPACANAGEPCKNRFKVTQTTDGAWYCDKCQGTYATTVRRWIFSALVEDSSGSTWVSLFNEQAEALLGLTADEAYEASFGSGSAAGAGLVDQDAYDSIFAKAACTEWIISAKVKSEDVNGEQRVKASVMQLYPVDYVQESKELLAELVLA